MSKWLRQTKTPARTARRSQASHKLHDVIVQFKHETPKAVLYTDGTKDVWIPKSALASDGYIQVEDNPDGTITLTAPESWLYENGLI